MLKREHSAEFELLAIGRQLELNRRTNTPTLQRAPVDDGRLPVYLPQIQTLELPEQEILPVGSVFEGRYEILGVAGKGGMGIVYKARNLTTQRIVAVKMLRKEYSKNGLVFRRFQKEAQAANLLNHPNIIAVHDFGMRNGDQAFLTMDFLTGDSLAQEIAPETPLPLDRFKHIFVQACNALQHAHRNGLVHRDIKPSNLILTPCGEDKDFLIIVDFGLVKLMSVLDDQRLTTTHSLVGSPLYMSPEQCTRQEVDHRSDIYSLGCTMYEVLTGHLPHHGSTPLETFCKHITEEPESLNKKNPIARVPAQLEKAILKALAKDPDDRQQSMNELREDIEKALAKPEPVSIRTSVRKVAEYAAAVPSLVSTLRMKPVSVKRRPKPTSLLLPLVVTGIMFAALIGLAYMLTQQTPTSSNLRAAHIMSEPSKQPVKQTLAAPPSDFDRADFDAPSLAETAASTSQSEKHSPAKHSHSAKKHHSGRGYYYYYYYYR
jgi:serine/threonine-protein kinase